MLRHSGKLLAFALIGGVLWLFVWRLGADAGAASTDGILGRPAPVEVAPIRRGAIVDRRVFSGTLEARAEFAVAPKVSGRIESLAVDVGDRVAPGAVVAQLDDDEFQQAVAEASAELEVARAELALARSGLAIAQSAFDRVQELREGNIASGSELDVAAAELQGRQAQVDVAAARVKQAEAALAAARVRLGYATVNATWPGSERPRVVAERYVDEGATVAANSPIVTVIDASTVRAVLHVTERDYARLRVGQPAEIRTDAYPGETFVGEVLRMSPVFTASSRQARVEVDVPNPDGRLRPGMFVRVAVVLDAADGATLVPQAAIVRRGGGEGLFVVDASGERVAFHPVRIGITEGDVVQVFGEDLDGRVVTLGQQLIEDGSRVRVAGEAGNAAPEPVNGG